MTCILFIAELNIGRRIKH